MAGSGCRRIPPPDEPNGGDGQNLVGGKYAADGPQRMSPASQDALSTLRRMARGHPGASSGERAAWDILRNLRDGTPLKFGECFVRLDGVGKRAVMQLLVDLTTGSTGLAELD